jgi:SAM-dependent methyltransferase
MEERLKTRQGEMQQGEILNIPLYTYSRQPIDALCGFPRQRQGSAVHQGAPRGQFTPGTGNDRVVKARNKQFTVMPGKQSSMQSYYAARAAEYDRIYLKPERQADLRAIEQWLPPKFTGARVIEVACGTGYWTQFIAPVAARVLALDTAPETISIAKSRVPAGKVDFLVGDAYALPPSIGQFDAAFAGFWFSHVPTARRREFLLGLAARLEPGARVVFLDNRYVEGSSTPVSARDAEGNTFQARRLGDGSAHQVLKNFPSEAVLLALVAGLGERPVFTTWKYYWAFEYAVALP